MSCRPVRDCGELRAWSLPWGRWPGSFWEGLAPLQPPVLLMARTPDSAGVGLTVTGGVRPENTVLSRPLSRLLMLRAAEARALVSPPEAWLRGPDETLGAA